MFTPRLRDCQTPRPGAGGAPIVTGERGTGFVGLTHCGSPHLCPSCAPRLAAAKALEIEATVAAHVAAGRSVAMVTLTLRHTIGMPLKLTLGAVRDGWRSIAGGDRRAWERDRRDAAISGFVRAFEVTDGANGWHPHLHVLLLSDVPPDELQDDLEGIADRLWERWCRAIAKAGLPAPDRRYGMHLMVPPSGAEQLAVARYISKIDPTADGGVSVMAETTGIGWEIAYGPAKRGRAKTSRTPLQLARAAVGGDRQAIARWTEYADAVSGLRMVDWSKDSKFGQNPRDRYGTRDTRDDEAILDHRESGATGLAYAPAPAISRLVYHRHDLLNELVHCATPGDVRRLFDRDEELRSHTLWRVESTPAGWAPVIHLPPIRAADP